MAASYGMALQRLGVAIDSSDFRRGGSVRVRVTYQLPLDGLPLIGWSTVELQREAVEPIDTSRSLL
jgi:hypothetical protein